MHGNLIADVRFALQALIFRLQLSLGGIDHPEELADELLLLGGQAAHFVVISGTGCMDLLEAHQ